MPTVILPTIAGAYMRDLFRLTALASITNAAPILVWRRASRADCSRNCHRYSAHVHRVPSRVRFTKFFVSSAVCFPDIPGPHFYLAGIIVECPVAFCSTQWGVMDIVEATPPLPEGMPPKAAERPCFYRVQIPARCGSQRSEARRRRQGSLYNCRRTQNCVLAWLS